MLQYYRTIHKCLNTTENYICSKEKEKSTNDKKFEEKIFKEQKLVLLKRKKNIHKLKNIFARIYKDLNANNKEKDDKKLKLRNSLLLHLENSFRRRYLSLGNNSSLWNKYNEKCI
jgi:predicted transcriptional regulator YdeE